jgi:DNA-binding MarR family transcriptional regulator
MVSLSMMTRRHVGDTGLVDPRPAGPSAHPVPGFFLVPGFLLHRFLSIIDRTPIDVNVACRRRRPSEDSMPMAKIAPQSRRPYGAGDYPAVESAGYLVRDAHRAFQKLLEKRIAAHGISRGQWYFLRILWMEDGLSQRELSARVGMMEPTTVIALRSMEKVGLIRRLRSTDDRRITHVWLTTKARRLRNPLLQLARAVTEQGAEGIGRKELSAFSRTITRMTANLDRIER